MQLNSRKLELLTAKQGLTWTQLAQRAGMKLQNLSTVKTRGTATGRTVVRIANALGVDPEELLEEVKENG